MSELRVLRERYTHKTTTLVIEFLKCGPDEAKWGHCCNHDPTACEDPSECELFSYYDQRFPWRTAIVGTAYSETNKNGKRKVVGQVLANVVNRDMIRGVWYDHMYAASPAHLTIAETVFDRQGYMHRALYEDEVRKGSGVFGKELGEGSFIHLESVYVQEKYRRRGLASKLIRGLHKVAQKEDVAFILGCPANKTGEKTFMAFVRSLGYRLVGRTDVVAYAMDEDHPSRHLAQNLDPSPLPIPNRARPLQYSTPACTVIDKYTSKDAVRILNKFPVDTDWNEREKDGVAPLHLAAKLIAPDVLDFLLSKPNTPKCMQLYTEYGDTPLGSLKETGESVRHSSAGIPMMSLDNWRGHADDYVECYRLLTIAANVSWDEQFEKRVRAGCTCGQCLEGVMSPRLKSYILGYIEYVVSLIERYWEQDAETDVVQLVNAVFNHLPTTLSDVRDEEPFQKGFATLLKYVAACLEENTMPVKVNVEKQIALFEEMGEGEDVREYLDLGGKIDDALAFLFGECCYKTWSIPFRALDETKRIPHCDNDDLIVPVQLFVCGVKGPKPPKSTLLPVTADAAFNQILDIMTGQYR